jgi:hypothetical protein
VSETPKAEPSPLPMDAAMVNLHRELHTINQTHCRQCGEFWPCTASRLLATIAARDTQIAALIAHCNKRHGCDIGEDPDYGF